MEEITSMSPVIGKQPLVQGMNFYDALREVVAGSKVARSEWEEGCWCFLKEEFLFIHRNGKDFQWIISLGDLSGLDWYVL